jgi:hypothetical protein
MWCQATILQYLVWSASFKSILRLKTEGRGQILAEVPTFYGFVIYPQKSSNDDVKIIVTFNRKIFGPKIENKNDIQGLSEIS